MTQPDRPTLTTTKVMKLLGVSRPTVTRLIEAGELDGYKLTTAKNSPFRIYRDTVDDLLERRQKRPSAATEQ